MGTVIAWVLVRDRFWGKLGPRRLHRHPVRAAHDRRRPGAAGALRPGEPDRGQRRQHRAAVFLALAFVTLPFVVRTVQPVLEELEADVEEAAASLGASRLTTFRRVILPSLVPGDRGGRRAVLRPRRSASTARWSCSPATCRSAPRSPRCGSSPTSRTATPRGGRGRSPRSCWSSRSLVIVAARRHPAKGGAPWLGTRLRCRCALVCCAPSRSATCSSSSPGRCSWWSSTPSRTASTRMLEALQRPAWSCTRCS